MAEKSLILPEHPQRHCFVAYLCVEITCITYFNWPANLSRSLKLAHLKKKLESLVVKNLKIA